jgi:hypothetical protein
MDVSALIALVPAQYTVYIFAAGGVAGAIATVLPKPTATTGWYPAVYKVVNFVGLNFGRAKNA